jgi:hypothetical protein
MIQRLILDCGLSHVRAVLISDSIVERERSITLAHEGHHAVDRLARIAGVGWA